MKSLSLVVVAICSLCVLGGNGFPPRPRIGSFCTTWDDDNQILHNWACLVDPILGTLDLIDNSMELFGDFSSQWAVSDGGSAAATAIYYPNYGFSLVTVDWDNFVASNSTFTLPWDNQGPSSGLTYSVEEGAWTILALVPNSAANTTELYFIDAMSGDTTLVYTIDDTNAENWGYATLAGSVDGDYVFLVEECSSLYPEKTQQQVLAFDTTESPWSPINITLDLSYDYLCFYLPLGYDDETESLYMQTADITFTGYTAQVDIWGDGEVFPTGNSLPTGNVAIQPYAYSLDLNVLYSVSTVYPPVNPEKFTLDLCGQDFNTNTYKITSGVLNTSATVMSFGSLVYSSH